MDTAERMVILMARLFNNSKNALVVHLSGEIEQCAANEIKDSIDIEILNSTKKNIIFNLEKVTLMDSSGIGLIVGRYKTAKNLGGTLVMCNATPGVRKMIDLSGIGKVITMYDTLNDADNALKYS